MQYQYMHKFLTGRSRGDAKHDFKSLNKIKEALQSNGFEKGLPDPPDPTSTLPNDENWMSEIQNLAALVDSDSSTSSNTTFKQFITPLGIPAFDAKTHNANADNGVNSAGFITTVQPAAKAGPNFLVIIADGKFQGVINAHTPIGS